MKILLFVLIFFLAACSQKQNRSATEAPLSSWVPTPAETTDFGGTDDPSLPNILILGDSISIGYTGPVHKLFYGKYNTRHPADNCRNSYYTLHNIDRWINSDVNGNNSIILWNNGAWDVVNPESALHYINQDNPKEWYTSSDEEYEKNIIAIANILNKTGARVIFFTTTDIPVLDLVFDSSRVSNLNEIAKRVLVPLGIEVIDLYSYTVTLVNAHKAPNDIHFTKEAYDLIGEFIKDTILKGSTR